MLFAADGGPALGVDPNNDALPEFVDENKSAAPAFETTFVVGLDATAGLTMPLVVRESKGDGVLAGSAGVSMGITLGIILGVVLFPTAGGGGIEENKLSAAVVIVLENKSPVGDPPIGADLVNGSLTAAESPKRLAAEVFICVCGAGGNSVVLLEVAPNRSPALPVEEGGGRTAELSTAFGFSGASSTFSFAT